jgi:hypothetical protein
MNPYILICFLPLSAVLQCAVENQLVPENKPDAQPSDPFGVCVFTDGFTPCLDRFGYPQWRDETGSDCNQAPTIPDTLCTGKVDPHMFEKGITSL